MSEEERRAPSGIVLPPRSEGPAIVVLQTAVPQLQLNVDLDHEADPDGPRRLAEEITRRQLLLEAGDPDGVPFTLTEPHFGLQYHLTAAGIRAILSVSPGYALKIDAVAASRRRGVEAVRMGVQGGPFSPGLGRRLV